MTSPTERRKSWIELLKQRKPDYSISLVFNDAAWVDRQHGGRPLSAQAAEAWILRCAQELDYISLGRRYQLRPEKRSGLICFPEAPNTFRHYHGFVWRPDVQNVLRGRAFPWQWFEDAWQAIWRKRVPGGSMVLRPFDQPDTSFDVENAARYATAEYYGDALRDYIISPPHGPLPTKMLPKKTK